MSANKIETGLLQIGNMAAVCTAHLCVSSSWPCVLTLGRCVVPLERRSLNSPLIARDESPFLSALAICASACVASRLMS